MPISTGMTDDDKLGNRYALSALRNKRATIASEIEQLERQLRHRREMLIHVDATLKILDPSIEVDAIPNKRPPQRIKLFRQGELGRMIIDAMRRSGPDPVSVAQITSVLLDMGGHGEGARPTVAARVRSNLAYLRRRGRAVRTGEQRNVRWRIAD